MQQKIMLECFDHAYICFSISSLNRTISSGISYVVIDGFALLQYVHQSADGIFHPLIFCCFYFLQKQIITTDLLARLLLPGVYLLQV